MSIVQGTWGWDRPWNPHGGGNVCGTYMRVGQSMAPTWGCYSPWGVHEIGTISEVYQRGDHLWAYMRVGPFVGPTWGWDHLSLTWRWDHQLGLHEGGLSFDLLCLPSLPHYAGVSRIGAKISSLPHTWRNLPHGEALWTFTKTTYQNGRFTVKVKEKF